MGWDYITYGQSSEMFHDMELWTVRHFLIDAAKSLKDEGEHAPLYTEAGTFFGAWDWVGPGVVTGTNLDRFVQRDATRAWTLVRVCKRAIASLERFGDTIDLDYLQQNINSSSPGGVYTAEHSAEKVKEAILRIQKMLEPDQHNSVKQMTGDICRAGDTG
jgi:hypothetical protein